MGLASVDGIDEHVLIGILSFTNGPEEHVLMGMLSFTGKIDEDVLMGILLFLVSLLLVLSTPSMRQMSSE